MAEATRESELRTVTGPSALAGGWKRFFELLYLMAVSDFKKTYFETVLGYAWSLLRPLMLFGVLLVVFTQVFRIGRGDIDHYPVFLLLNIVLFTFFQESTNIATTAVVGRESIVRKTQFPRLVIPMSIVLTSLFNLGMNLIAVLIFTIAFGVEPTWTWLLFPVSLVLLIAFTGAVATFLSGLFVRHRDVSIIWSVLSTALFYGSAVLYPVSIVPDTLRDVIFLNPLVPLFVQTDKWIVDPGAPSAAAAAGGWEFLIAPALIFVVICVGSIWFFNREAPRVAEEL